MSSNGNHTNASTSDKQDAAPAIVVEGLVRKFGDVVAVDGIDFTVPAGTVLGLLGPNGAGKTTTVRMLTTILKPTAGRATVLGLDVVKRPHAVRSVIGLAGQYAAVDEALTGRENLRMIGHLTQQPAKAINPRADELLERFTLAAAADRPVRTYSGGMRRRLDLAAALVHKPPVLFLDEPTTGLDPPGRNDLWALIGELVADGTTLLLTTQYLEEADRLADNIIVIDGGHIVASRGRRRSSRGRWAPPSSRSDSPTPPTPRPPRGASAWSGRSRCSTTAGPSRWRSPTPGPRSWRWSACSTAPTPPPSRSRCASPPSTTCSCSSPATRPNPPHPSDQTPRPAGAGRGVRGAA